MPAWEEGIKKGDLKAGKNGDPVGLGSTGAIPARKLGYEKPMKAKLPNLHYLKKTELNEKGDINTTSLTDCVLYSIVSCFIGKLEQTEDGELVISPKLLMTGKEDNQHLMTYNFFKDTLGLRVIITASAESYEAILITMALAIGWIGMQIRKA